MKARESDESRMKLSGVYAIVNLVNGKRYVGSASKSFQKRKNEHTNLLRNGNHHSVPLQRAWNKYGEQSLEFHIEEVTLPEHAVACEQSFIDFRKSADRRFGYNISPVAGSCRGVVRTPETRKLISEILKARLSTPEARRLHGERIRIARENPVSRKACSDRMKVTKEARRARKAQSERAKVWINTPEVRKANSERAKLQFSTPEARKAQSERSKARNADPARKATFYAKCNATRLRNKLAKASEFLSLI